jgi:hypothetical protein
MSKLLKSIGLKDKRPAISTTVAELAPKNLKSGYFSKRGPTRSSKYNMRYWVLTESHLYYFTSAAANETALGMIDLKCCKLNIEGCAPCEWVILCATSEKSREYFCKADTPENRTAWGGVIQSVINRLIDGRATFHGTPTFSPISPRSSAPETSSSSNSGGAAPMQSFQSTQSNGNPLVASSSNAGASGTSDSISAQSHAQGESASTPALSRGHSASNVFGTAGPVAKFNPVGGQEIIRVFLPDLSSKTILFNTTQSIDSLAQQVSKKLGPGYDLYGLYSHENGEIRSLTSTDSVISVVGSWPSKNDPEHYRLVYQPKEESDRQRASTIGFLNVQTNANTHSHIPKSSSFVSQVMTAIKKKPEWTGNLLMSALPTPHLHRGVLSKKKSSQLGKVKDVTAIVTESALYYFDVLASNQTDRSKGWIPLEKSALFQERGPCAFVLHYVFPGTLDVHCTFDVTCKTEEEKVAWINVLSPRCKGVVPVKKQQRRPATSSLPKATTKTPPPKVDVAAMLQSTPSEGPKLTHPTAGRPKAAAKRPPSGRPKGVGAITPAGTVNLFGPGISTTETTSASTNGSTSSSEMTQYTSSAPSSVGSSSSNGPYGTPNPYGSAATQPIAVPGVNSTPISPRTEPSPRLGTPTSSYGSVPLGSAPNPYLVTSPMGSPQIQRAQASTGGLGASAGGLGASTGSLTDNSTNSSPRFGTPNSTGPVFAPIGMVGSPPSLQPGASFGVSPREGNPTFPSALLPGPSNLGASNLGTSNPLLLSSGAGIGSPPNTLGGGFVAPTATPPLGITPLALSGGTTTSPIFASPSPRKLGSTPPSVSAGFFAQPVQPIGASETTVGAVPTANNGSGGGGGAVAAQTNTSHLISLQPSSPAPTTPPLTSGPILTGPNPNLFQTGVMMGAGPQSRPAGPSGYVYNPATYGRPSNPALNPASTSPIDPALGAMDSDTIDVKALMGGFGSPALPQQSFPAYQSPHFTTPVAAPAKTSNIIYSPVLAKPMPLQATAPDTTQKVSSPMFAAPTTTISILPLPSNNTTPGSRNEPTPSIIMDILSAPMDPGASPFDDLPFD